jgi:hypothetical protein
MNQKTVLMVTLTVLVTAVLVGGGTYYLLNAKADKDQKALQTQIDELTGKVATNDNTNAVADVTADWKTYTNTDYGFSFKYPINWNLNLGKPNSSANIVDKIDFSTNLTGADGQYSYFSIESKTYSGTASDYLAQLKQVDTENQNQGGPSHNFPLEENVTLGTDWLKLSDVMTLAAKHDWYIKDNSGKIFVAKVLKQPGEGPITDISSSIDTANSILSTLQFTNNTADWKTYTNTTFGYSVKYPKSWGEYSSNTAETVNLATDNGNGKGGIQIVAITGKTLDQAIADSTTVGANYSTSTTSDVVVGGEQGKQIKGVTPKPESDTGNVNIFVKHNTTVYRILGDDMENPEWSQIITTFEFTK